MRIAGFRVCTFHEGRLHSVVHSHEWERGINQSRPCQAVAPIFSDDPVLIHPATLCRCGFHAFYDPADPELVGYHAVWVKITGAALAVIVGSGTVVLHQKGWRAQKAEIVGVVSTGDTLIDNVIRNTYDVPLCRRDGVRPLAEKFGHLVTPLDLVNQQWIAG